MWPNLEEEEDTFVEHRYVSWVPRRGSWSRCMHQTSPSLTTPPTTPRLLPRQHPAERVHGPAARAGPGQGRRAPQGVVVVSASEDRLVSRFIKTPTPRRSRLPPSRKRTGLQDDLHLPEQELHVPPLPPRGHARRRWVLFALPPVVELSTFGSSLKQCGLTCNLRTHT